MSFVLVNMDGPDGFRCRFQTFVVAFHHQLVESLAGWRSCRRHPSRKSICVSWALAKGAPISGVS